MCVTCALANSPARIRLRNWVDETATQPQEQAASPAPSAAGEEALALINQTLRARPDVVPFVLEMIAAFVEETPEA